MSHSTGRPLLLFWAALTCRVGGAVLVCLAMAGEPAAQAPAGEETKLRERYEALFQEMFRNPRDLEVMFEFARVATLLEEYEPAISTLERMLIFNPALPRVRLELGALYYRIGAYAVAEGYFAQVAEDPNTPAAVMKRVAEFRDQIESRTSRHQVSGRINTGLRYQTNANGGPADATVRVLGLAAELDQRFTAQEDFNWFASAVGRHTYDLGTRTGSWLESTGQFYASRQFEQEAVDLTFLQLTSGPRLALTEDGMRGSTVRPYLVHSYVQLDTERLYLEAGGGAEFGFPLDDTVYLTAGTQLVYQDYGAQWEERDGWAYQNEMGVTVRPVEQLEVTLSGWVMHDDARVVHEENNEVAAFASVAFSSDPGLPGVDGPLVLRPYAGVIRTSYGAPDPTIDPTTSREDTELRIGLVGSLQVDGTVGLQLTLSHADNKSNLPNFDYRNNELALSISMSF